MTAVASGLGLYSRGGSVTITSVTANSRRLGREARQLLQTPTKSVNVAYTVTYPATAATQGNILTYVQNQLGSLLYGGAVTAALQAAGFAGASANAFSFFQLTPSPTPSFTAAPTAQLSPGKIAAAVVLSILGCCCFGAIGYYFAFLRGGSGGGAAQTSGGAPDLQFSNVAPGPGGRDNPTAGALI